MKNERGETALSLAQKERDEPNVVRVKGKLVEKKRSSIERIKFDRIIELLKKQEAKV